MIDTRRILRYLPNKHGEHGVDSVIHRIINCSNDLFESYCNPPGASWAGVVVKNHQSDEYVWDHVPRNPNGTKRPDHIIQFNDDASVNFLAMESKEKIANIYRNIDGQLKNFFYGNEKFNGLLKRPMRHKKSQAGVWEYIENTTSQKWLNNEKVTIYSGFAFSFDPETYDSTLFESERWLHEMENIRSEHLLDVVIGVGWWGEKHMPFVKVVCGKNFSKSDFGQSLKSALAKNSSI